jgi:hypothetical protein
VGAHTAPAAQFTVTVAVEPPPPLPELEELLPPLQATRLIPVHKRKNNFFMIYLQSVMIENECLILEF